jgi:hypothetical protein
MAGYIQRWGSDARGRKRALGAAESDHDRYAEEQRVVEIVGEPPVTSPSWTVDEGGIAIRFPEGVTPRPRAATKALSEARRALCVTVGRGPSKKGLRRLATGRPADRKESSKRHLPEALKRTRKALKRRDPDPQKVARHLQDEAAKAEVGDRVARLVRQAIGDPDCPPPPSISFLPEPPLRLSRLEALALRIAPTHEGS